jgi:hypothetical protein
MENSDEIKKLYTDFHAFSNVERLPIMISCTEGSDAEKYEI